VLLVRLSEHVLAFRQRFGGQSSFISLRQSRVPSTEGAEIQRQLLLPVMCRDEVCRAVGNRHFTFSLLVHSDASSPMVDWSQNSSILQV
jgi:hypothetical protein